MSDVDQESSRERAEGRPFPSVVIISGTHDYRMARRAGIQAIADALVRSSHDVSFLSLRFSLLSLIKGDSRNALWSRANKFERHNQINCYLWRTALHPFATHNRWLDATLARTFSLYGRIPNRAIDETIRSASFVIVESGLGVMLLRRVRALNPTATVIYRASDQLDTVDSHPAVQTELEKCIDCIDHVILVAEKMAPGFAWASGRTYLVPPGIHPPDFAAIGPNPYASDLNAVSVGAMLFDADFFTHAAARFPQVEFHVIGSGKHFDAPKNVRQYPEMPFKDTLPFVKHATFGIAPYLHSAGAEYLSQSSLKLMQYEYLGIPAVCPYFAVGDSESRFGYIPGDAETISAAIEAAMTQVGRTRSRKLLTWDDIAGRTLFPASFPDTFLPPAAFLSR